MTLKQNHKIDLLTTLLITGTGIFKGQVTVFYIIYLYWFQELMRAGIDFIFNFRSVREERKLAFTNLLTTLFMLFLYVVFILVLFGFMLNWDNNKLILHNMKVVFFMNPFFNFNVLLFLIGYFFYKKKNTVVLTEEQSIFHKNLIVLHLICIWGGVVLVIFYKQLGLNEPILSLSVLLPFLLLKAWFGGKNARAQSA